MSWPERRVTVGLAIGAFTGGIIASRARAGVSVLTPRLLPSKSRHARFRVPAADKVIAPRPKNAPDHEILILSTTMASHLM